MGSSMKKNYSWSGMHQKTCSGCSRNKKKTAFFFKDFPLKKYSKNLQRLVLFKQLNTSKGRFFSQTISSDPNTFADGFWSVWTPAILCSVKLIFTILHFLEDNESKKKDCGCRSFFFLHFNQTTFSLCFLCTALVLEKQQKEEAKESQETTGSFWMQSGYVC